MAKISDDDINQLRETADIVELASAYTHLKQSGRGTFKGLCPFHSEKTPSFTVNRERGLYFCFGCGEGGDIYSFVEKIENLSFPDAVEWLARRYNYVLRYEEARPGQARAQGLKLRLKAANAEAARFFHRALMAQPEAAEARRYLEARGFTKEVAERWLLGYAPGRDALTKHLLGLGFGEQELIEADLARRSERGPGLYDTFRRRIVFPTWDRNGDVVGFGARALGDQQPKYLNSAETQVFHKSRVLYGLDRAKSSIARGNPAVVVEGYTDVIALHEAGITEAVATNGVALGESHLELLKRYTDRVVLMFDADDAGTRATERGFGLHHRIGLEVMVALLPAGRDPADVVTEDGPEAIRKVIEAAVPLTEFKLEQVLAALPLDTPEARAKAARVAAELLAGIPDELARRGYVFSAAERIGVDADDMHRVLGELLSGTTDPGPGGAGRARDRRFPGHVKVEREALRLLLTRPALAAELGGAELIDDDFTSATRQELFRAARAQAAAGAPDAGLAQRLSPEARALFSELTIGEDAPLEDDDARQAAREVFTRLQVFRVEREIKRRRDVLQKINPQEDPAKHDELFTELVRLEARRRDLQAAMRPVP
jgi:DNA primase